MLHIIIIIKHENNEWRIVKGSHITCELKPIYWSASFYQYIVRPIYRSTVDMHYENGSQFGQWG